MSEDTNSTEGGIKTPLGEVSFKGKRTAEFITILSLLLLAVLATLYWQHDRGTSHTFTAIAEALKEQTIATRASAQAQRYMACIISEPQSDRPRSDVRERCREISKLP